MTATLLVPAREPLSINASPSHNTRSQLALLYLTNERYENERHNHNEWDGKAWGETGQQGLLEIGRVNEGSRVL